MVASAREPREHFVVPPCDFHRPQAVYAANAAKIEAHNAAGHSWTMGVNKIADMMADEFKVLDKPMLTTGACVNVLKCQRMGHMWPEGRAERACL